MKELVRSEASKACFLCDLYGEPCSKNHDLVEAPDLNFCKHGQAQCSICDIADLRVPKEGE